VLEKKLKMSNLLYTFRDNPPNLEIVGSRNSIVEFSSGLKVFDTTGGGTSNCTIGWGNDRVLKAMAIQMTQICHSDYKSYKDQNREQLADLLVSTSLGRFKKLYLAGNSGGEACEAAMKLSFQAHNFSGEKRHKFLCRSQSYHGSSTEAMSMTDRPNLDIYKSLYPKNKLFVPEHNFYRCSKPGETEHEYLRRELSVFESVILENEPETICAFVCESFTGGLSGFVPPIEGYLQGIQCILKKYGIHLILDEVICGNGVTGNYYAFEPADIYPDFLFMGKGLASGYAPISAVLLGADVSEVFTNILRVQHSTTHQGYSLGVAAAVAVQEYVSSSNVLNRVTADGEFIQNLIKKRLKGVSNYFKNVRGRGYRFALEYDCPKSNEFGMMLANKLFYNNQVQVDAKWHRISFSPMMCETRETLANIFEKICGEFISLEEQWPKISSTLSSLPNQLDPHARAF